ncbi:MAG: hypothetical protein JRN12_04845 [Nitrososphaerota archaeon]|jgi:predicted hydrocarbon binding protein|nr:hypothetical protein [Nitrososphaerota archaeon]MDG6954444.1 hypothetical protein [Nitrososphaerota archaeon]
MSQGARGIPIFVYAPGEEMLRITSVHKNVPGSFSDLISRISEAKLNILSMTTSVMPGEKSATMTLVVENAGGLALSEIKSKLEPSALVPSIEVELPKSGLLVESKHFPIVMSGGERLVLMRTDMFLQMILGLKKTFGTGGDVILYRMGYTYGETAMKKLVSLMGKPYLRQNFNELVGIYTALGWSKPLFTKLVPEGPEAVARVEDSFECAGQRSALPASQFLRGHMTAVMDAVWGKRFRSKESKCLACGDGFCEFEFRQS